MNILNRVYYKPELSQTIERLENLDFLNDSLLDELQAKIYLLMKQKYFQDFKTYSEFQKILLKNDFIFKYANISSFSLPTAASSSSSSSSNSLSQTQAQTQQATASNKTITNPIILADQQHAKYLSLTSNDNLLFGIDDDLSSPTNTPNISLSSLNDSQVEADSNSLASIESLSDRLSQSSYELCNNILDTFSHATEVNFKLSAIITACGRCNELKTTYAIYIIDVIKDYGEKSKNEYWQTYRRFNDFYDLHLMIKKKVKPYGTIF